MTNAIRSRHDCNCRTCAEERRQLSDDAEADRVAAGATPSAPYDPYNVERVVRMYRAHSADARAELDRLFPGLARALYALDQDGAATNHDTNGGSHGL